jgi:hypothetical protein
MKLWRWLIVVAGIGATLMLGTIYWLYQSGHVEVITNVSSGNADSD